MQKAFDFTPLEQFLDKITAWRIPGNDMIIHYKGEEIFRHTSGYRNLEKKEPVRKDDIYLIFSATKLLTCTAALSLVETGDLVLTDPLWEYLPEFKEMYVNTQLPNGRYELQRAKKDILLLDLFRMTAGFSYDTNSPSLQAYKKETNGLCPTRGFTKALSKEPLLFEPGTRWNYSLCHDVLGALIEEVSGKKFGVFLQEKILDPVGMSDTHFFLPEEKNSRVSSQYRFDEEKNTRAFIGLENDYRLGTEYESGGAGLFSTVQDYIRFTDTLCHWGKTKKGDYILSPASISLMRLNQLNEETKKGFNWSQLEGYGYGLGVRTLIDKAKGGILSSVCEFGWSGAAGAFTFIDPENELSVFYVQHLRNSSEPYIHPRLRNVVYSILRI